MRTKSRVNWDQDGYRRLLAALGDPQHDLPPVIHVAGTNGKGSIVAMLRAIYEAAGYRVHAYTSPHLLRMNERIVLGGEEIGDEQLERRIDDVLEKAEGAPLSFFEITTALALKAFAENPADVLLLETGMGGRLDCTNVVEKPLAAIISRVSMDHTEFLGDTIEKIAAEKAGIIKPGVPCVAGYQGKNGASVLNVLQKAAQAKGASFYACGADWDVRETADEKMLHSFQGKTTKWPVPALAGAHQLCNAGAVLTALQVTGATRPVSRESCVKGLQSIRWPGRLQRLPVAAFGLSESAQVWLDCGHNDSAGEMLAQQAASWAARDPMPLHLVVGMLGTKDARRFLEPLLPHSGSVHLVPVEGESSCLSEDGLRHVLVMSGYDRGMRRHESVAAALESFRGAGSAPFRLLIAGSVYLAGNVLRLSVGEQAC